MSVENFDGHGYGDQPSIIYGFGAGDSNNAQVCELVRSGFGEAGPSPGDAHDDLEAAAPNMLPTGGGVKIGGVA